MVTQNDNSARGVEYSPEVIPIYSLRMKGKVPYDPKRLITQAEYVLAKVWWDGLSDSSRVELGLCNEFQLQNALQDCKTWLAGSTQRKTSMELVEELADEMAKGVIKDEQIAKLKDDIKVATDLIEFLKKQLRFADKNYLNLKNAFDTRDGSPTTHPLSEAKKP